MFQMAIHKTADKYYLYGTEWAVTRRRVYIYDVTDARNPKLVNTLWLFDPKEYPTSNCLKLQVADDLLIVSLMSGGGPSAVTDANEPKNDGEIKMLNGIYIYSIKEDPINPELISYWDNGVPNAFGVHRFMYNGGRYVHLASDAVGFEGMIYRVLDIEDLKNPVEVGRWWVPDQYADGYPGRTFSPQDPHNPAFMDLPSLHGPPFVVDNKCYMGYSGTGLVVLDVSDLTRPKCLGQLKFQPAFSGGLAGSRTHTALPLPKRNLCVVTNEGERYAWFTEEKMKSGGPQPINSIHMVDVSNPNKPTLIAQFPYPEVPPDYPYLNFNVAHFGIQGPFGPHNIHEPMENKPGLEMRDDRIYCCYFHAGMRVYDISDQYNIKEIAYFIPPNPDYVTFPSFKGPRLATTEDVVVDDRGNIFMSCLEDGLYVLRVSE
jgi:hypothetical protein